MRPKEKKSNAKSDDARSIREELAKLGAPRVKVDPATVQAMKPETRGGVFSRPGWLFELKYDGFRTLAAGGAGEARLFYKSGHDATRIFPELVQAVAALPFQGLILDGETVILDHDGRPNFQKLQRRGLRTRASDTAAAAAASPATLFVFDLLAFEDFDLRPLPLTERKKILRRVVPPDAGWIRLTDEIPERGADLYAAVSEMGLEGVVGKRADSPYRAGYSTDWLKFRVDQSSDFAVIGFEPIHGSRTGFRRLRLAAYDARGRLVYAGSVGTGFNRETMDQVRARLEPLRRDTAPVAVEDKKGTIWVDPQVVVEVRYKEWTEDGRLRHPVFLRVRDDKTADECVIPGVEHEREEEVRQEPAKPLNFTNLDKVFWPGEGITKGDLIDYYRTVAPWMLPYLKDRPLVLDRYPDGIAGKSFFQKSAPESAAGRIRTAPVRSEGSGREIDYLLCDDVEGLLYLVQLGAIPFHFWSSRIGSPDRPDWCILDLDPKTAPFDHVVTIALAIRELCEEIAMPCFIKTSGGSGLHILLPLGGLLDHEQSRQLGEVLAGLIVGRLPQIATTARAIQARRGKVYVDALQNGRGKLLAATYAVRPRPGAPVSTPLDWSEVNQRLDVGSFNIKTVPKRLKKKGDPNLPVLSTVPDLERSLALLSEKL
ncbi:MAG TPA: DNA ligase D [Thermoanaerobaculia bacterium]